MLIVCMHFHKSCHLVNILAMNLQYSVHVAVEDESSNLACIMLHLQGGADPCGAGTERGQAKGGAWR